MKYRILFLLMLLAVSCAPLPQATEDPNALPPDTAVTSPPGDNPPTNEPSVNPLAPQPGDSKLVRGNVFINEASLVIRESYPPQISLAISGDLPTPCNQLRVVVNPPDEENKIMVDVYSVIDPDKVCIQVLEPFQEYVDLGTFPSGHYTVWANGEMAGEFDT